MVADVLIGVSALITSRIAIHATIRMMSIIIDVSKIKNGDDFMKLVPLFFILFGIGLLLVASHVFLHEHIHQTINEYDGLKSEIRLGSIGAYTIITSDGVMSDEAKLAHMINEVVGYTVVPFLIIIAFLLLLILIYR